MADPASASTLLTDSAAARTYRAAFRSTPTAVTLLSVDLVVLDVNAAFTAATGRAAADLVGKNLFEAFPNNPDLVGEDHAAAVRASLTRVRDTGEPDELLGLRYDIPSPDGFVTRYWDITNVPVLDDDGVLVGLLNRVQDVTVARAEFEAHDVARTRAGELQVQVASAQADLLLRAAELQRLNERLRLSSDHDRSVAQALQSAMLTRLPEPDHLHLAARYLTATGGEQVGGDWYDAVLTPGGATTVMIGDVVGHDIDAAGLMGQLRSMLRAFTWDYGDPPSRIVSLLDRSMRDLGVDTLATLVVLCIEQDAEDAAAGTRTLRWTNAGHPPPVLVGPDGDTTVLHGAVSEPLLGIRPDLRRSDHTHPAPPGSTLLLYTDGLIETRGEDLDHGLDLLRASLTRHHRLPTEDLLDAVLADTVGEHPDDDVAVLAVRFHPEDRPRPAEAGPAHP
ncbi:PP2C family protein-serine/threonine phosphatase [Jatrophihabitans sp. YIM 134969]